jgi:putative glycosyltransferase
MALKISVVTTLYYSEDYISEFYQRTKSAVRQITNDYEFVFVNDGSPDGSVKKILALQKEDPRVVLIDLSRNFGHHQAILTGLQHAKGEYVFLIDCDLEEDPELINLFWDVFQKDDNVDVVYGVQTRRKGNLFERITGNLFYKILDMVTHFHYPANTLTARLMKQHYVTAVLNFKEKALDVWAIFLLAGFNQRGIPVEKKSKGSTTYTLSKKIKMSIEIMTSLSHRPLYSIFFLGIIWVFISGANIVYILVQKWLYGAEIEGWASIMASLWLIGGVVIFMLGLIGIYLSKIFLEIKNRPLSIIKTIYRRDDHE